MISPDRAFWSDGYAAGKKAEQERIIKLLNEERGAHPVGWDYNDWLIALIKGENND